MTRTQSRAVPVAHPFTTRRALAGLTLVCAITSTACGALTREEAQQALDEVKVDSQAQALTSDSVELSTNFSIGQARDKALGELKAFIGAQLPCAATRLDAEGDSATLTIEYGASDGKCTYRGHTWSGRHIVSVAKNDDDLVQVDHVWEGLSNGKFSVDGSATVEWDRENKTRHVVHDATWTRLSDGRSGEGSGDRVQRALDGGLAEGFSVDGKRHWSGKKGDWDLDIDGVEMRWIDPVPQAGTYTLDTPFDKRIEASFERVSPTSIQVTLAGPKRSFDFKVSTLPSGESETEAMPSDDPADDANDE
jgi:hypothetical protein